MHLVKTASSTVKQVSDYCGKPFSDQSVNLKYNILIHEVVMKSSTVTNQPPKPSFSFKGLFVKKDLTLYVWFKQ